MVERKYRLALAKLLKLYKEISTKEAVLVAEADEIEVGTEVYVESEEGMTPAPDGVYTDTVENKLYTVTGGTITEIKEKETTMETGSGNGEEGNQEGAMENQEGSDNGEDANNSADGSDASAEGQDNGEGNQEENRTEDKVAELESALEAANAKIAELEATVSDLEDQIAAYKAKEEETEAPAAEDAEKFAKESTGDSKLDKKLAAARRILNAVK